MINKKKRNKNLQRVGKFVVKLLFKFRVSKLKID